MRLTRAPIAFSDEPFLYALYATTREAEMALVPWSDEQKRAFLEFQFQAQQRHYREVYPDGTYETLALGGEKIGRLYVGELADEVRIIDLLLLPAHRGVGFEEELLEEVLRTAAKPVRIYLEHDDPQKAVYERLGFAMIRDEGFYHLWECRTIGGGRRRAA